MNRIDKDFDEVSDSSDNDGYMKVMCESREKNQQYIEAAIDKIINFWFHDTVTIAPDSKLKNQSVDVEALCVCKLFEVIRKDINSEKKDKMLTAQILLKEILKHDMNRGRDIHLSTDYEAKGILSHVLRLSKLPEFMTLPIKSFTKTKYPYDTVFMRSTRIPIQNGEFKNDLPPPLHETTVGTSH